MIQPFYRCQLVVKPIVPRVPRFLFQKRMWAESERSKAVIAAGKDDAPLRVKAAVKRLLMACAALESPAVDIQDDRRILAMLRHIQVQILAVLTVRKINSLTELPVIKAFLCFRLKSPLLHSGRAELRGTAYPVPMCNLSRILPPSCRSITDAEIPTYPVFAEALQASAVCFTSYSFHNHSSLFKESFPCVLSSL